MEQKHVDDVAYLYGVAKPSLGRTRGATRAVERVQPPPLVGFVDIAIEIDVTSSHSASDFGAL